ncbi:hypothetical protein EGR_07750 [Echinococcus granulosus]|uniref:Uncharacterized protein n=1 Tax=Echinococcus granulosus TaxID=6210 RepID=W6UA67_ECHGR|nr:hypothetical protein EGR_07750 [Echinococcus granulosus]EUB57426.1 hypothetical protein EGR_07750 [Echinococcus granulosus]
MHQHQQVHSEWVNGKMLGEMTCVKKRLTFDIIAEVASKQTDLMYIIDSDLSSSISDFTESSSFPSPQLQASMPIPDSLYIILNECYTHRHPFLDDSAILVAPDVLGNPLSPHISDLLFQCP